MKKITTIIAILLSVICYGQHYGSENPYNFRTIVLTTDLQTLGYGSGTIKQESFVPKKIISYDTVKCIVIYLDGGYVKGGDCVKIFKATATKNVYHSPEPCTYYSQGGCAANHMGIYKEEPDFQLFKVVLTNKKEIPLKNIIQYK